MREPLRRRRRRHRICVNPRHRSHLDEHFGCDPSMGPSYFYISVPVDFNTRFAPLQVTKLVLRAHGAISLGC